jgi:hypothetical protein
MRIIQGCPSHPAEQRAALSDCCKLTTAAPRTTCKVFANATTCVASGLIMASLPVKLGPSTSARKRISSTTRSTASRTVPMRSVSIARECRTRSCVNSRPARLTCYHGPQWRSTIKTAQAACLALLPDYSEPALHWSGQTSSTRMPSAAMSKQSNEYRRSRQSSTSCAATTTSGR